MFDPNAWTYYGKSCTVDNLQWDLNSGPKIKIVLEHPSDYKSFEGMTKRRGKKAGQILMLMIRRPGDEEEFQRIDAWFAGYTVTHTKGCVIACTIDDDDFDHLRVLEQKQVIELMVYEIEEDGTSHNAGQREVVEAKLKGGPLSIKAARACRDEDFQLYLKAELGLDEINENVASEAIRKMCGVKSRSLLDHDEEAKQKWTEIHRGYIASIA